MRIAHTLEEVALEISLDATCVIAIDGFQASGKTTLAQALAEQLNLPLVSADDYLFKNQGAFFEYLQMEKVSAALRMHERCIFEGVCCLKILQTVDVNANLLVYVKRMAIWGWADESELESVASVSSATIDSSPLIADTHDPVQINIHNLWKEVALYHKQYRPHEVANIVYERDAA
jgi:hypothetical protein